MVWVFGSGLVRRGVAGSCKVWDSRRGGARCGLVRSGFAQYGKAWVSWRGSARR